MASYFYKDGKATKFEEDVCPEGYTDAPHGWTNPEDAPKKKETLSLDAVVVSKKSKKNKGE